MLVFFVDFDVIKNQLLVPAERYIFFNFKPGTDPLIFKRAQYLCMI